MKISLPFQGKLIGSATVEEEMLWAVLWSRILIILLLTFINILNVNAEAKHCFKTPRSLVISAMVYTLNCIFR